MASLFKTRSRRGKRIYVIDFHYPAADGTTKRYRKDAKVQLKSAAEQEALRLFTGAMKTGCVPGEAEPTAIASDERGWTFAEAVEFWEKHNVRKHTTRHGYGVNFAAHLLPRFKSRGIHAFGHADITKLRAELKDLKTSTVNNIEIALRAVLRFAKVNGHLDRMPDLPPLRKVPPPVVNPPQPDDVAQVIGLAYPAARLAMALAAYAGLRSGEIRGLRFMDVDLVRGLIIVRQAICRGVADAPKSGHERKVPIASPLSPLVKAAFERTHTPTDCVSVSSRGEPWADGSLLHAFRSVLAKAKLPASRMHDLRHFFVTECFRAGVPAPDVQKLAGHRHLHVTQRYAHTDEESQREAMAAFSARIVAGGACAGKSPRLPAAGDSEAVDAGADGS